MSKTLFRAVPMAVLSGFFSAGPSQAQETFAPVAVPQCSELAVSAGNTYLDFSPIEGGRSGQAGAVACTRLPPAQYQPRTIDIKTPSGVKLGLGKGGQIYSIRIPGIREDILPNQRQDAFYVDEVFQTAAANIAIKRQSPRSLARTRQARRGPSWHYHQAGAYQRGALRGLPTPFSPIVYNRINENGGYYESLNIALQAHTRHPTYKPDRFLVFSRIKHIGDDVFEVVQAWINNSYRADPVRRRSRTSLDHFNFPWLVTRQRATPFVVAQVQGEVRDLSALPWPPRRGDMVIGGGWFGGFASAAADAPGYIVTMAADRRTRLRLGSTEKSVVTNVAASRDKFQFARQRIFVIGAVRTDKPADPGDVVVAKFYLLLGPRAKIQRKAARLHAKSTVRRFKLDATASARNLVGYCITRNQTYEACSARQNPNFWLTRTVCSTCPPLYELRDRRTDRMVYSTDPYIGYKAGTPIDRLRYVPQRILGWLVNKGTKLPRGMTAEPVSAIQGLHSHAMDRDTAYLVRRRN